MKLPSTLPGKLPGKPDLVGKLPNWLGGDGRPRPGDRPSAGDLKDFLDLPGGPGGGDRPSLGVNKPGIGDKSQIGDRTKVGDININTGNKITVNRQNNVNSIRNKYNHIDRRPFDRDWGGPAHVGWVLMARVNTGDDEARALADLFAGVPVRVHLIDVNDPTGHFAPPTLWTPHRGPRVGERPSPRKADTP